MKLQSLSLHELFQILKVKFKYINDYILAQNYAVVIVRIKNSKKDNKRKT